MVRNCGHHEQNDYRKAPLSTWSPAISYLATFEPKNMMDVVCRSWDTADWNSQEDGHKGLHVNVVNIVVSLLCLKTRAMAGLA